MSTALAEVCSLEVSFGARRNEALLSEYAHAGSARSLDTLVRDNQPLLHHILKGFASAAEPYEDLLQVANLGLIKAAQNYDPARGVRFATYVTAVVDGEIRHYLRDSVLMRQPRWARRMYGQIQVAVAQLGHQLGRTPELAEIAEAVNLSKEGVLEIMGLHARVVTRDLSESSAEGQQSPEIDTSCIRSLRMESFTLPIEDRIALEAALNRLSEFQRRLVDLLFYREFTQREVADLLGVTTKKVSRELGKTLLRLKQLMGKRVF